MFASRLLLIREWAQPPNSGFVGALRLRGLASPYRALAVRIAAGR